MLKTLSAAIVLMAASASPAYAVTFVTTPGSAATFAAPSGGATVDFNGALPMGVSLTGAGFSLVSGSSGNMYAQPAFSDGSRYLAVLGGGTATLASTVGYSGVSLFLGSLDSFNTIDVLSVGGALLGSFTGSLLALTGAHGSQTLPASNARVTFANVAGEAAIGGLRLSSGQNALEADNVAFTNAVPEPATWAMMLIGFGAVGYSMRRRRDVRRVTYAV